MERVSATDLGKHWSARLERVRGGESLLVTDREQPVAMLVSLSGIEPAGGLPELLATGEVRAPKERFQAEEWDRLARPPADSPGLVAAVHEDREER